MEPMIAEGKIRKKEITKNNIVFYLTFTDKNKLD